MHQEFLKMLALRAMDTRTADQDAELTKLTEKFAVLAATWQAVPTPTSYNGNVIDVTSKATWKLVDANLKGKALTEAIMQLEAFCKVPAETQLEAIPFGSVLTDRTGASFANVVIDGLKTALPLNRTANAQGVSQVDRYNAAARNNSVLVVRKSHVYRAEGTTYWVSEAPKYIVQEGSGVSGLAMRIAEKCLLGAKAAVSAEALASSDK